MSVAKVTEISAGSPSSFEDAINKGLDRANETLTDIEGAWIKEMKVVVKGGRVQEYRVNMKLSFVVH
jgi:flavin-binding protein dodecin